jgi:hypothetical protein
MSLFHTVQKYYVSSIDYFLKKQANKPLTASQKANLARCERIAKLRDHKGPVDVESDWWS